MTQEILSDILHREVVTCGPHMWLRDVVRTMVRNDKRRIVVCTDGEAGMRGEILDWMLAQTHRADRDGPVALNVILLPTATASGDVSHVVSCFDINNSKGTVEAKTSPIPLSKMETFLVRLGTRHKRGYKPGSSQRWIGAVDPQTSCLP